MSFTKAKSDLDHQVWKLIKNHSLQDKKILVALSGGVDSVALLQVLARIHNKKLTGACYFHHGESSNRIYRNQAQSFCEDLCKKLDVHFVAVKASQAAHSEEEYRTLRYAALERVMSEGEYHCLATAHHRDDLLETRMLRLIRGTGSQGLQAMHVFKDHIFRPFLEINKKELKSYLKENNVEAIEDPSNENVDPLRNWIRQNWLVALESRVPGSTTSLARSLETIALEIESHSLKNLLSENIDFLEKGLSRSFYFTLSPFEQRRLLAQYLYALGKKDFSKSHLEEIQKRLDNSQKVITFRVAGCLWEVNAGQIKVQSCLNTPSK
ncbi:MAG: tRNA lysidine(34) synthetase TilS [Bdellovibrio sp.]